MPCKPTLDQIEAMAALAGWYWGIDITYDGSTVWNLRGPRREHFFKSGWPRVHTLDDMTSKPTNGRPPDDVREMLLTHWWEKHGHEF